MSSRIVGIQENKQRRIPPDQLKTPNLRSFIRDVFLTECQKCILCFLLCLKPVIPLFTLPLTSFCCQLKKIQEMEKFVISFILNSVR